MSHVDPYAAEHAAAAAAAAIPDEEPSHDDLDALRMNTDDIMEAAERREKELEAVSKEMDQYEQPDATEDSSSRYEVPASPSRMEEFGLLHTAEVDVSKEWLIDAFNDPRHDSIVKGRSHLRFTKNVGVATLFPLPTSLDFCMTAIGTESFQQGVPRSRDEVEGTLAEMQFIIESCLRLALLGDDGANADDDSSAYDVDEAVATWDLSDPLQNLPHLAKVPGAIDFLLKCGISRIGTRLAYRYERVSARAEDVPAPPLRLVLGLSHIKDERRHMLEFDGETKRCTPIMASYAKFVSLFDAADKRSDNPLSYPTFDDLIEWVQLRNYFYLAMICASGELTDGEDGGEDTSETWMHYFGVARNKCQELLDRIETYHSVFKLKGLMNSPVTLLGDSLALKLRLQVIGADSPGRTPPRKIAVAEPGSPTDLLTRTPTRPADRAMYLAARPPLSDLYRDPDQEHAGFLNIRQCCFVNAFVQFVYSSPEFVSAVFGFPDSETLRAFRTVRGITATVEELVHERVLHRLQAVMAYLKLSESRAINTIPLLDAVAAANPQFGDGGQHDPHEFASAVFDSLEKAYTSASDADPDVKTIAEDVQWQRFVQLPLVCRPLTRASLRLSSLNDGGASPTKTPATYDSTESTFIPAYFEGTVDNAQQKAMQARAASLLLPGGTRKETESGEGATAETAPVAAQDATDDEQLACESTIDLTGTVDDFFNEVIHANATPSSPDSAVCAKLRCVQNDEDSSPAMLFVYAPSRVVGTQKRFDRVQIPQSLDLGTYRDDSATDDAHNSRLRRLSAEVAVVECEAEIAACEKSATLANEAVESSVPDLRPAAAAFAEAVSTLSRQAKERRDEAEHQVKRLRMKSRHSSSDSSRYELVSLIVHVGQFGNSGHYVTYSRVAGDNEDGGWCLCDDSAITALGMLDLESEALERNVYCLAYKKIDVGLCGDVSYPVPQMLQHVIERENLRVQLQIAQAISE